MNLKIAKNSVSRKTERKRSLGAPELLIAGSLMVFWKGKRAFSAYHCGAFFLEVCHKVIDNLKKKITTTKQISPLCSSIDSPPNPLPPPTNKNLVLFSIY